MNIGGLMALIIIAVMLAVSLKNKSPEISSIISLGLCLSIIAICVERMKIIVFRIKNIAVNVDIDKTYIKAAWDCLSV